MKLVFQVSLPPASTVTTIPAGPSTHARDVPSVPLTSGQHQHGHPGPHQPPHRHTNAAPMAPVGFYAPVAPVAPVVGRSPFSGVTPVAAGPSAHAHGRESTQYSGNTHGHPNPHQPPYTHTRQSSVSALEEQIASLALGAPTAPVAPVVGRVPPSVSGGGMFAPPAPPHQPPHAHTRPPITMPPYAGRPRMNPYPLSKARMLMAYQHPGSELLLSGKDRVHIGEVFNVINQCLLSSNRLFLRMDQIITSPEDATVFLVTCELGRKDPQHNTFHSLNNYENHTRELIEQVNRSIDGLTMVTLVPEHYENNHTHSHGHSM